MKLTHKLSGICLSTLLSVGIISPATQANETFSAEQVYALYEQGVEALGKGQFDVAQQQFQQIVNQVPDNAQYRYALSVAHSKAGNYGAAWQQLREALRIAPDHEGAQDEFMNFWRILGNKQLFNVGTPAERIRQIMGEPDKVTPNPQGETWDYAFMSISLVNGTVFGSNDWRGLNRDHLRPLEKLDIAVDDRNWIVNHRVANYTTVMTEYVVPPQVVQDWQELFSTQRLLTMASKPPADFAESIRQQTLQIDPDAYWNIIQDDGDSILYEWRISASQDHPAQHEIARVIRGQRDLYRVAYVAKVDQLDENVRSLWIQLLQKASIRPFASQQSQSQNAQPPIAAKARSDVWQLGLTFSMAGLGFAQGADQQIVDNLLQKTRDLTADLAVTVPDLPSASADKTERSVAALNYLLESGGGPIANALHKTYGPEYAALFEMAMKANLLLQLYAPGDSTGLSLADVIERNATRINLPVELWQPLVHSVRNQASFETVKSQLNEMNVSVKEFLI